MLAGGKKSETHFNASHFNRLTFCLLSSETSRGKNGLNQLTLVFSQNCRLLGKDSSEDCWISINRTSAIHLETIMTKTVLKNKDKIIGLILVPANIHKPEKLVFTNSLINKPHISV